MSCERDPGGPEPGPVANEHETARSRPANDRGGRVSSVPGVGMIRVERLSKRYGGVLAVDRLSFEVGRGEIVGLLGPNGAGKTTTMRMLTTFLAPTSGVAVLAGHDVLDAPLEVRRHVGYLPESVPL